MHALSRSGRLGQAVWKAVQGRKVRDRHHPGEGLTVDYEGQINAMSKSQAVIQFNTDGTVVTANDNFLNAFGHSLTANWWSPPQHGVAFLAI